VTGGQAAGATPAGGWGPGSSTQAGTDSRSRILSEAGGGMRCSQMTSEEITSADAAQQSSCHSSANIAK
jgi:hypothetical protein